MNPTFNDLSEYSISYYLDLTGLICPEPLMLIHKQVKIMKPGEVVQITATDPATRRDIPNFCNFLNHKLLLSKNENNLFIYHLRIG
jgi:tRNA 2-thiouridine synthesizing protein A